MDKEAQFLGRLSNFNNWTLCSFGPSDV